MLMSYSHSHFTCHSSLTRHYVDLEVSSPLKRHFILCKPRSYERYSFRFKKIGFEHATDNKVAFDQFFLVDYVYESFSRSGAEVMDEAHLFSHFNHARLANPITPYHADESMRDLAMPSYLLHNESPNIKRKRRKNGRNGFIESLPESTVTHYQDKNIEI